MDARGLLRRWGFVLALGATGCDGKTGLEKERDALIREREFVVAHQTNLQIAALSQMKGRGFQDLSAEESGRVALLFQQRAEADARLRIVDARLEQVQNEIYTSQTSYP